MLENRLDHFPLMYVRAKYGREVDFVVTERDKPFILVESKKNDKNLASNLKYFKSRVQVPLAFQVVGSSGYLKQVDIGTYIIGLDRFL